MPLASRVRVCGRPALALAGAAAGILLMFAPAPAAANEDLEIVDFVANQLAQQRAELGNVEYTVQFDLQNWADELHPFQSRRIHNSARVWNHGNLRRVERSRGDDLDGGTNRVHVERAILTDSQIIIYSQNSIAHSWTHAPGVGPAEGPHLYFAALAGRDCLLGGYGTGWTSTLAELRVKHPDAASWSVEEVNLNGREALLIHFYIVRDGQRWRGATYTVDLERGFMVVGSKLFTPNGQVRGIHTVSVDRVGPQQHWFPVRIEQKLWEEVDGKLELGIHEVKVVSEIRTNCVTNPDDFTIEALNLPNLAIVSQLGLDGKSQGMQWVDGRLVSLKSIFARKSEIRSSTP